MGGSFPSVRLLSSLVERPLRFITPGKRKQYDTENMPPQLPTWAQKMAWVSQDDASFPAELEGINLVLNRVRLATFLSDVAKDRDVKDLLAIDLLCSDMGVPLSSTGDPRSQGA
jgi:hypothetical protein